MHLTNFLNPTIKLNAILYSSTALAAYASFMHPHILACTVPAIATTAIVSYFSRDIIDLLHDSAAIKCSKDHPLTQTVLELVYHNEKFSDLENIDVFIFDTNTSNAFACGFFKSKAAIYVSTGILEKFDNDYSSDKLKAVLAHELGHVSGNHLILNSVIRNLHVIIDKAVNYIPILAPFKILSDFTTGFIFKQLEYDADHTAIECGYGVDLVKGLSEIHGGLKPHKDSIIFGTNAYLNETFASHPTFINRAAAINASLHERNTEYDNLSDWFFNSLSHTADRFFEEHLIHFSAYSSMIGINSDLNQYSEI